MFAILCELYGNFLHTFCAMNWSLVFVIVIALILLRSFILHVRANNAKTASFQRLCPKDQMAVLKECLLNNPTQASLDNLKEFCEKHSLEFDAEGYKPFIKEQLELAVRRANYVECDRLYVRECAFIDKLEPMEFADAEEERLKGETTKAIAYTLEGISRLYSDAAIEASLKKITAAYPKAEKLLTNYQELVTCCNESEADEKSLESLRKKKEAWVEDLLDME